jgi:hypothetical protein
VVDLASVLFSYFDLTIGFHNVFLPSTNSITYKKPFPALTTKNTAVAVAVGSLP